MKIAPLIVAAAAVIALGACAPVSSPPRAADTVPTLSAPAATPAPVVKLYHRPDLSSAGSSAAMSAIAVKLGHLTSAHPTVFGGIWFSLDGKQVVVRVAKPDDPAAKGLAALRLKLDPKLTQTLVVETKYSSAQFDAIIKAIGDKYMGGAKSSLASVGLDPWTDVVVVTVLRTGRDPALADNPVAREIATKYGDAVQFDETSQLASTN